MKILTQRPTHVSAVATVLLITKTFTVKRERDHVFAHFTHTEWTSIRLLIGPGPRFSFTMQLFH